MIGLCFYFEESASKDAHIGVLVNWAMTAASWGVTRLMFVDRTKSVGRSWESTAMQTILKGQIPVTRVEDFGECYESWPAKYVFCEEQKQSPGPGVGKPKNLANYKHPDEPVVYVFGGELWGGIKQLHGDILGDHLYVDCAGPSLGLQMAAVVFYDRKVKSIQRTADTTLVNKIAALDNTNRQLETRMLVVMDTNRGLVEAAKVDPKHRELVRLITDLHSKVAALSHAKALTK